MGDEVSPRGHHCAGGTNHLQGIQSLPTDTTQYVDARRDGSAARAGEREERGAEGAGAGQRPLRCAIRRPSTRTSRLHMETQLKTVPVCVEWMYRYGVRG